MNCYFDIIGYSFIKVNTKSSRYLRPRLEGDRIIFREFIRTLEYIKFLIVYIYEWLFN